MITNEEAILYYADHPVEFVEDIIGATPDPQQAKILQSVFFFPRKYGKPMKKV